MGASLITIAIVGISESIPPYQVGCGSALLWDAVLWAMGSECMEAKIVDMGCAIPSHVMEVSPQTLASTFDHPPKARPRRLLGTSYTLGQ